MVLNTTSDECWSCVQSTTHVFYVAVQKGAEDVNLALFKAINHILDWLPGLSSVTLVTEKM